MYSSRIGLPTLSAALLAVAAMSWAGPKAPQASSPLANATVLVIRHAEKPEEGTGLTPAGEARAKAYALYFHKLTIDGKPFRVNHIFATKDSKKSYRERLTVEPLGKAVNLAIDDRFKNNSFAELAEDLKTHPYGKDILICWHHGKIPELVQALGGPTTLIPGGKWPAATFDWVVELKFDPSGKIDLKRTKVIHEHLMPGDSK